MRPRGAVVAEPRAVHGGAAPSVRGSMDGRAAGALQDGSREVGDRGGSSRFTAGPPLPRTPVQLRARADSRQAGRSEVEVAGYDDYEGEDDWPHDDEVWWSMRSRPQRLTVILASTLRGGDSIPRAADGLGLGHKT